MFGWRMLLWAVIVVAALSFLFLVRGILLPFITAFIVASLLEPAVRKLRMRGVSRHSSVWIVMGAFGLVVIGGAIAVAPTVVGQISSVSSKVDVLTGKLGELGQTDNFFLRWNPLIDVQDEGNATDQVDHLLETYGGTLEKFGIPATRRGLVQKFVEPNQGQIVHFIQATIDSFFGIIKNLPSLMVFVFLTPLLTYMILQDMENFKRKGPRWIPPAIRESVMQVFEDIGQVFFRYLRGVSLVVMFYAIAQTIGMMLMQVPYAILLGAVFGVLYLIPFIGNIISALSVLLVVGISEVHGNMLFHATSIAGLPESWSYAIVCMLVYLAIGLVFDHLIYPQVVGNTVGLSPFISLFVIFCGDALFGLPGMVVAFPLAGSVKVILDRLIKFTSTSSEGLNLPSVPLRHRTA